MADKIQETLLDHFRSVAGDSMVSSSDLLRAGNDNRAGISGTDTAIPVIGSPPKPTASSGTSSAGGSSALSLASEMFGSGLGILPLVTGLMSLFGGGSSKPPPLTKYAMPQRLDFVGAETSSGIAEGSYDQIGMPRIAGAAVDSSKNGSTSTNRGGIAESSGSQINVTVQAMDAQSFMDRSTEIAQAVRQAMLNSSSINDVINDL